MNHSVPNHTSWDPVLTLRAAGDGAQLANAAAGSAVDFAAGIIVIGRNEAARLEASLRAAIAAGAPVLYVDSGSTDASLAIAQALGVEVLPLDASLPYTAARARNAGLEALLLSYPDLRYVQFVDGDCQLAPGWMASAVELLDTRGDVAAVTGILQEQSSQRSPYTRLCHIEWSRPVGAILDCGGLSMVRVAAFQQVSGFNPEIIAGEDTELFVRLRLQGWKLWSLGQNMASHSADLVEFRQWWLRTIRSGYAYAEGKALHGQGPLKHWVKENRSIWLWGFWLPLAALLAALETRGMSLVVLMLAYGYTLIKTAQTIQGQGHLWTDAWLYSGFCLLGKVPQMLGQFKFYWRRWQGKAARIIEYK